MQPAEIDFLEVEKNIEFDCTLNLDGYDFTDSTLKFELRLRPELDPIIVLEDEDIFREITDNETGWGIKLKIEADMMDIQVRDYKYQLIDQASDKILLKGFFKVI